MLEPVARSCGDPVMGTAADDEMDAIKICSAAAARKAAGIDAMEKVSCDEGFFSPQSLTWFQILTKICRGFHHGEYS